MSLWDTEIANFCLVFLNVYFSTSFGHLEAKMLHQILCRAFVNLFFTHSTDIEFKSGLIRPSTQTIQMMVVVLLDGELVIF